MRRKHLPPVPFVEDTAGDAKIKADAELRMRIFDLAPKVVQRAADAKGEHHIKNWWDTQSDWDLDAANNIVRVEKPKATIFSDFDDFLKW